MPAAEGTSESRLAADRQHPCDAGAMSTLDVRTAVRLILAAILGLAGVAHFAIPRPCVAIVPPAIPAPEAVVMASGIVELLLAAGLVGPPRWRRGAALATAAYLVVVFPANIYAAISGVPADGLPPGWSRWVRLPLQLPLIAAALWCTAEERVDNGLGGRRREPR